MRLVARIALILFPLLAGSVPVFSAYEQFVDIHPAGWSESAATCINEAGDVVGHGVTAQGERGFLWSGGSVTEILPPGADSARASSINGAGDIAGTAVIGGVPHAFLFRGGQYLDPTPGWAHSTAVFVGDDGTVAGSGEFGAYVSRGGVTQILAGFSAVLGRNSAGQLIGRMDNAARLYIPGQGYLDLTPPLATEAFPGAINENGLVALTSSSGGVQKGFVYSGGWFIQMTPQGWNSSRAAAVNNYAAVVGFGEVAGTRKSFVRSGADYEYVAFPGWSSTEAVSLNDLGQVAGSGLTASGDRHAFVASPAGASGSTGSSSVSASGGCAVSPRSAGSGTPFGSAVDIAVFASPLLVLLGRRLRGESPSSSRGGRSPMILGRTRFRRRPSSSP